MKVLTLIFLSDYKLLEDKRSNRLYQCLLCKTSQNYQLSTDSPPLTMMLLTIFQLHDSKKAILIQYKLCFEFWILIFSCASDMQYSVMLGSSGQRSSHRSRDCEGKQWKLHAVLLSMPFWPSWIYSDVTPSNLRSICNFSGLQRIVLASDQSVYSIYSIPSPYAIQRSLSFELP